ALMLGLLVAGVALASERRLAAGLVLCALATAVKAPAALGIVYVAFAYASPTRLRTIGWSALAAALTFAGLIVVAISRIVGLGWGWIGALRTPEQVKSYLSVTTAVGSILGGIAREIGGPSNSSWAISTMRMSGLLVALAIAAYLLAKRHDIGSYRALALTFLAGVACAPVIQPWYLTWGIVLLAATGVGRFEDIVVWISAVLALLISPRGSLAPAVVVVVLHALTIVLVVRSRLIPTFAVQWTSLAERWRQRGWPGIGEPYLTMSPSDQQP
ncbi:MAG: alpha,6-mannosyltransferase, partial [Mycobacterium sp.]|nr:alpha,6-mannosyltransferase [Mycobacterium sp.]